MLSLFWMISIKNKNHLVFLFLDLIKIKLKSMQKVLFLENRIHQILQKLPRQKNNKLLYLKLFNTNNHMKQRNINY